MEQSQLFEGLGIHARPGLRAFDDGQLELFEEQIAQLNSRVDIELTAGDLKNLPLQPHDLVGKLAGKLPQAGDVDTDAVEFHCDEHIDQRHFQSGEQLE